MREELVRIEKPRKGFNFIKPDGSFLCEKWFEDAWEFRGGYAVVKLNRKCNLIDCEGNIIFKKWFEAISFIPGLKIYKLKISSEKWKVINSECKYISRFTYIFIEHTQRNLLLVQRKDKKFNFLTLKGKLCLKDWVFKYHNFNNYHGVNLCRIYDKDKGYNFITPTGELFSKIWFNDILNYEYGKFKILLDNGDTFFIDLNGNFILCNE